MVAEWDIGTGRALNHWPVPPFAERHVIWSRGTGFTPDGELILDRGVLVRVADGAAVVRLAEMGLQYNPAAVSPDGRLLATGVHGQLMGRGTLEAVMVWELATAKPVVTIPTNDATLADFSADGGKLALSGFDGVRVHDLRSGGEPYFIPAHERFFGYRGRGFASSLAVSPDGRTVATGHADTTVLVWEIPPTARQYPRPRRPDAQTWDDLASDVAAKGFAAVTALTAWPDEAVAVLRGRLRPAEAVADERFQELMADLDHASFRRRCAASDSLRALGRESVGPLRAALAAGVTKEQQRRSESILADVTRWRPLAGDDLRAVRAVQALEWIGTVDARRLLRELAKGTPKARLTREASEALQRLPR